jgi:ATP-binding cassette, subfamily C (CFTR/MRP), member 1
MAISIPLLIAVLFVLQHCYLRTARQMRLLDLEAKSPLYSHFSEIWDGLATIRAFGWQQAYRDENHKRLDMSQRPYYLLFTIQQWLELVLNLIVAGEAAAVIGLALWLRQTTNAGNLGVALTVVLSMSFLFRLFPFMRLC